MGRGEIEAVFEHWKEVMDAPRSKLDQKRRDAIASRLKDGYTLADLCDAVNGCKASAFHMGQNERRKKYNDIALVCRDAEHVDRFIEEWEELTRRAAANEPKAEAEPVSQERGREYVAKVLALARRR